jgi:hypothetical protein
MDRPPGGWSDLVTNQTLTDKLDALRQGSEPTSRT